MTLSSLITELKTLTGFQVAFDGLNTEESVSLPFINVETPSTMTFAADNVTYFQSLNANIELYTKYKDQTSESTLETKLTSLGFYFSKQDIGHLDSQACYEVLYQIGV